MSTAGIVVARPNSGGSSERRSSGAPSDVRAARAAAEATLDELVVVLIDERRADEFPTSATLLVDTEGLGGSRALRSAVDWCQRGGHDAVVVAIECSGSALRPEAWSALGSTTRGPIVVLEAERTTPTLARISVEAWPTIPIDGPIAQVSANRPELVVTIEDTVAPESPSEVALLPDTDEAEIATVTRLLGRPPQGRFSVVVRSRSGEPVVIENAPFLDDGTPMPTRYWLVGKTESEAVGRLESTGGVRRATEEVPAGEIAAAHARYAAARDARIAPDHLGPRPYGGVGGTREGVKCLHAHLAWYLAGGADPVGRWTAAQLVGQIDGPIAAIDCGTNSTRLLIVDSSGATVAREMTITRLGEGVDRTGELGPEAIARTFSVLRRYRELCDRHGVVALRAAATSAARDARNAATFFDGAEAILGVVPELLSGAEEGRLSYAGATSALDAGPYLVCDLGGGSTELVAGDPDGGADPAASVSLALGCVRVTERFLDSDPPTAAEIAAARTYARAAIADAISDHPQLADPKVMIGLAGTVSALTVLAEGLDAFEYERVHLARLSRQSVESFLSELGSMSTAERRRRPGLEVARADVIVGGTIVLAEVMDLLGHEELICSESDILDGLVADLRRSIDGPRSTGPAFLPPLHLGGEPG
jgi:exopolyphosphatase/guanosine-5'-triphosphate,3'-diphosphate pyrophosphatase